jgi:hypothetical protein
LLGGENEQGWPFGRAVYISEIYQQLDQIDGVEYVENVIVKVKPPGQNDMALTYYQWEAHQLVQLELDQMEFTHAETNR